MVVAASPVLLALAIALGLSADPAGAVLVRQTAQQDAEQGILRVKLQKAPALAHSYGEVAHPPPNTNNSKKYSKSYINRFSDQSRFSVFLISLLILQDVSD